MSLHMDFIFLEGIPYIFYKSIVKMLLKGENLKYFHTMYDTSETPDTSERPSYYSIYQLYGQNGLTFKNQMVEKSTKLTKITLCFRVKVDHFTNYYTHIVQLLDGGGNLHGNISKERAFDFQIR